MDIDYIRKKASLDQGRRYLEDSEFDAAAVVMLHKAAAAENRDLLIIAGMLPGDTMENYEELGGTFRKEAIGAPMFQAGGVGQTPRAPGTPTIATNVPKPPGAMALARGQTPGAGMAGGNVAPIKEPTVPGIPGAGKTAAVRAVRRALQEQMR
jgi:hypothetical protein